MLNVSGLNKHIVANTSRSSNKKNYTGSKSGSKPWFFIFQLKKYSIPAINLSLSTFLFIITTALMSCDPIPVEGPNCHRNISFANNSSDSIAVSIVKNGITTYINCNELKLAIPPNEIEQYSSTLTSCWEDLIRAEKIYNGSINVIISGIENNTYGDCNLITINGRIDTVLNFTIDELNNVGWVINYQ